ncbi:MAG: stage 0 sporulation family protein [Clostridiales Family XIII bacterium]|nr:stage 0 sporulation family protein [Clostridiales Family XIII bacterium]
MRKVVAVKFRTSAKHYYFDPGDLVLRSGDAVVVETSRGVELGWIRGEGREVAEEDFGKNIKLVKRKATESDLRKDRDGQMKKKDAIRTCKEQIAASGIAMKLIDAEYTFDGNKLIFYFTSEKRVDFRDLVKELAGQFRMRIELRQIGVRDEARMLGGLSTCGRELCCKGWLMDFEPVSIKMAKVQNLSLNPGKISGCCGRLMCCLKYENDVYVELKKGLPNPGEFVDTPGGKAKVMDVSIFKGIVRVKYVEAERTKDGPEQLSSDMFEYDKTEIRRKGKRVSGTGHKKSAASASSESFEREIADALKDDIIEVIQEDA